jgi:GT2 family glycosyltransferase
MAMVKEKFPEVKCIENTKNVGFSAANNQAIKQSAGEYVLLLNPDTIVEEETFSKVITFMDSHPDAGGLGVKMIDGKGHFLPESKRALPTPQVAFYKIFGLSALFPRSKKFGKYHLTYLSPDETNEVEVLAGAFMLIRKSVLDKIGLLDETFFMYGEDIDMSYRITQAGYKNYYYPGTRIIHYKGESTKKSSVNYVIIFYNAMRIFAQKHFSQKNARTFSMLINMAIFFRASIAIIHRFIKRIQLPITDALFIYLGYYYITLVYENFKFSALGYYTGYFLLLILPGYILIWIFSILLSGGYDKPFKTWQALRGVLWGSAIILILYALLPEEYRFSRALILIGTAWVLIAITLVRVLMRALKVDGFGKDIRRILIIGKEEECKRVHSLLNRTDIKTEAVQYLDPQTTGKENTIEAWSETMTVYNINQVIFCAKDISSELIMDAMSSIPRPELEFKIAPPESWAVIGSNSIHTSGELYVIDMHAINTTPNIRSKRIFDFFSSLLLLVFSPLLMWVEKNPFRFLGNIFAVMFGVRSWVGYAHAEGQESQRLPSIKPGVLNPLDGAGLTSAGKGDIHNLNAIYARDYRVATDLKIIWKGFRQLGR